jgi:CHASE2 domain-containing sensor protein
MSQVVILVAAANPEGTPLLNTNGEVKALQDGLNGKLRHLFAPVRYCLNASAQDLISCIQQLRPHVVHFSGHGSQQDELVFSEMREIEEREDGKVVGRRRESTSQSVGAETLTNIFRLGEPNLKLVVLNACYSATQAQAIAQHVDCVLGIAGRTHGLYAERLAKGLYQALANGYSISKAIEAAEIELSLPGAISQSPPVLSFKWRNEKAKTSFLIPELASQLAPGKDGASESNAARAVAEPKSHPQRVAIWLGLACAVAVWLISDWSLLRGLDDRLLDGCFILRGKRPTNSRIVLISLDSSSLTGLKKQLPSLSPELAKLIGFAQAQGAKAIGVDLLLPADREALAALDWGKEGDTFQMGQAVVKAGIVTLPVWRGAEGWMVPVKEWRLKVDNNPEMADLGFINLQKDSDQIVRRQQLLGRDGDRVLPQMALALYARAGNLNIEPDDAGLPLVGGERVPVDAGGTVRINYVGPQGSFKLLPFNEALQAAAGRAELPQLKDAVVMIGITAPDQPDHHFTPFTDRYWQWLPLRQPDPMPGVEIHAHTLATLIDRAYIRTPYFLWPLPWLLVLGVVLGFLLDRFWLMSGLAILLAHQLVWIGATYAGFTWFYWHVRSVPLLFLGLFVYVATAALRWRRSRGRAGAQRNARAR